MDLAGGRLRIADSKTEAGIRHVDLLPVLRDELLAYKARSSNRPPDALVFGTATGGPQNRNNVRRRVLQRSTTLANEHLTAMGKSTIPEGITPHSLRRTFASLRLAIGDEVPYVMQQLGHSDPKLTLGVYAQVMFRKDDERQRLCRLVGAGGTDTPAVIATAEATSA